MEDDGGLPSPSSIAESMTDDLAINNGLVDSMKFSDSFGGNRRFRRHQEEYEDGRVKGVDLSTPYHIPYSYKKPKPVLSESPIPKAAPIVAPVSVPQAQTPKPNFGFTDREIRL